jgi:hypothetical protein
MRRAIPLRLERLSQLYPRLRDPCRDIQAPTAGRPRPTAPLPAPKRNWGAMGLGRARRVGALAALLLLAAAAGRVAAKGGDAARDDDPPLHRQGSDSGARVDAALPQPEAQLKKKLFDGYDKVGDSGMEEGGGWERWQRRWPAPAVRGAGRAARRGARRGRSRGARPCLRFPLTDRARLIATACRRATPGRSTAPPTSLSTSPSTRSGGRGAAVGGAGGGPGSAAGRARQRAGLGGASADACSRRGDCPGPRRDAAPRCNGAARPPPKKPGPGRRPVRRQDDGQRVDAAALERPAAYVVGGPGRRRVPQPRKGGARACSRALAAVGATAQTTPRLIDSEPSQERDRDGGQLPLRREHPAGPGVCARAARRAPQLRGRWASEHRAGRRTPPPSAAPTPPVLRAPPRARAPPPPPQLDIWYPGEGLRSPGAGRAGLERAAARALSARGQPGQAPSGSRGSWCPPRAPTTPPFPAVPSAPPPRRDPLERRPGRQPDARPQVAAHRPQGQRVLDAQRHLRGRLQLPGPRGGRPTSFASQVCVGWQRLGCLPACLLGCPLARLGCSIARPGALIVCCRLDPRSLPASRPTPLATSPASWSLAAGRLAWAKWTCTSSKAVCPLAARSPAPKARSRWSTPYQSEGAPDWGQTVGSGLRHGLGWCQACCQVGTRLEPRHTQEDGRAAGRASLPPNSSPPGRATARRHVYGSCAWPPCLDEWVSRCRGFQPA